MLDTWLCETGPRLTMLSVYVEFISVSNVYIHSCYSRVLLQCRNLSSKKAHLEFHVLQWTYTVLLWSSWAVPGDIFYY